MSLIMDRLVPDTVWWQSDFTGIVLGQKSGTYMCMLSRVLNLAGPSVNIKVHSVHWGILWPSVITDLVICCAGKLRL